MPARLGKWAVVVALIFSVGGHWAFLQTVAWAGMAVSFAQKDSVSTALVKTFNGKNPCKLCKFVDEGKDSESKSSEAQLGLKKIEAAAEVASFFWFPRQPIIQGYGATAFSSVVQAPPTPPPLLG